MTFEQLFFYGFSALLVFAATMVITSRNPVRGVLFLVMAFVASACLWLLLQAEFLALVLVLVYVGAVMTLFMFVVMMLDIRETTERQGFVRFLLPGALVIIMVVTMMVVVIKPQNFGVFTATLPQLPADHSNVQAIGAVLYTDYLYPFELAGVLLLAAIVAAISLSFRGLKRRKSQVIEEQLRAQKAERLRVVQVPSGGKSKKDKD